MEHLRTDQKGSRSANGKSNGPWYSLRMRWVVWVLLIVIIVFVLDLVRDYYLNGDELFTPEEQQRLLEE
jgi:hypothetical protein